MGKSRINGLHISLYPETTGLLLNFLQAVSVDIYSRRRNLYGMNQRAKYGGRMIKSAKETHFSKCSENLDQQQGFKMRRPHLVRMMSDVELSG